MKKTKEERCSDPHQDEETSEDHGSCKQNSLEGGELGTGSSHNELSSHNQHTEAPNSRP